MDGMSLSVEEVNLKVQNDIEQYGWSVLAAEYKEMMYVHTVGLEGSYGHPEIEILGLSEELSATFLNQLAQWVKNGETLKEGRILHELVENYEFILSMNPADPQGPPCTNGRLRLVWQDCNHLYPWDPECDDMCAMQTLLPESLETIAEKLI